MNDKKVCGFCLQHYEDWTQHAFTNPICSGGFSVTPGPYVDDQLIQLDVAELEAVTGEKLEGALLDRIREATPAQRRKIIDFQRTQRNQRTAEPALRYDADKSRVDLIDPGFLLRLGQHYGVGAKKYAERNWQKGMSFSRCYASAQRHMLAFWGGEDHDEETGSRHVIAAAWNMAAIDYYLSEPALAEKFDDRPKKVVDPVV